MSAIENSAGTLLPLPIKIAESFPFIFPSYLCIPTHAFAKVDFPTPLPPIT